MVTLTALEHYPHLKAHYPALAHAVREISTPLLRNMGTIGGNLLLDTRCTYYDQTHEWRESIDFCMKSKEGIDLLGGAGQPALLGGAVQRLGSGRLRDGGRGRACRRKRHAHHCGPTSSTKTMASST